jgi:hypothetical protein
MHREPLPAEIRVTELQGGGARFTLPRRRLTTLRRFGMEPLAFGSGVAFLAAVWTVGVTLILVNTDGPWAIYALGGLLWLIGVSFFFAGLVIVGGGAVTLIGRTVIELRGGRLWVTERLVGPMRQRMRRIEHLRRFRIVRVPRLGTSEPEATEAALLVAECGERKAMWIATGYAYKWLAALAAELARRCESHGRLEPIEVVTVVAASHPRPDRDEPPPESRTVLSVHGDGVTITLPRPGLWRGARGWLLSGLIWLGLLEAFTSLALTSNKLGWAAWIAIWAFRMVYWSVGALILTTGIYIGQRRAVLAVAAGRLLVLESGRFGTRRYEWTAEGIASVVAATSGLAGWEHHTQVELLVHGRNGETWRLLAGRDRAELEWVATQLRRALGCGPALPG